MASPPYKADGRPKHRFAWFYDSAEGVVGFNLYGFSWFYGGEGFYVGA